MSSYINDLESIYGPLARSDSPFKRKARLLQSYYRTEVLKEPVGVGPYRKSSALYGNMLREGAITGKNFLNKDIFNYARRKVDKKKDIKELTIDEFRLFNNMLSSMPMCFNLFYPFRQALKANHEFVHKSIQAIFKGLPIARVTFIDIEYVPLPIEDYIDDKSAFDAIICFEDDDNQTGIIGIETKYTDRLGTNKAIKNQKKVKIAVSSGIFTKQTISSIKKDGCKQIMRNVLLTESYRLKHQMKYSQHVILSPNEEVYSYKEVMDFQTLLLPNCKDKIIRITLEDFISASQTVSDKTFQKHLKAFHKRYLDFQKIVELL
jgi:hypothetical protein